MNVEDCGCPTARHQHGTNRNYVVHRCRCFRCRVAHANAQRAYRASESWREMDLMPSVGVRRRLQALAAIGYNARDLATHLDMTYAYVSKIRTDSRHPTIRRETHDAVCRVYDELWGKQRTDTNARRTMTFAAGAGYVPPLAWDDDEIDDPAATPHTPSGPSPWDLAPCGTTAAVRRHYRRGEPLCDACTNARRRHTRDRKDAA